MKNHLFNWLQRNATKNLFENPSKGQLIGLVAVWFIGVLLSFTAMTDLFTVSPFQGKHLIMFFLVIYSTIAVSKAAWNFRVNQQKQIG